jgi:membrane protease YdiL (CAAX protease family)
MINFIREELGGMWQFLKRNANETIIIVSAMLFFTLHEYRPIGPDWLSAFLYFGFFPLLVIIFILKKNPLDFGLRWGVPRIWGYYVLIICAVAGVILYASSFSTALQSYYSRQDFNVFTYILASCISLAASEFMHRGFLLFGLKEKFGEGSILLQMVPFVLLHFSKPELETVSTILTGILFGYVVYRGKSYWPAFFIHVFINVFFVVFINLRYPAGA